MKRMLNVNLEHYRLCRVCRPSSYDDLHNKLKTRKRNSVSSLYHSKFAQGLHKIKLFLYFFKDDNAKKKVIVSNVYIL